MIGGVTTGIELVRPAGLAATAPYAYAAVTEPGTDDVHRRRLPAGCRRRRRRGQVTSPARRARSWPTSRWRSRARAWDSATSSRRAVYVATTDRADLVAAWDVVREAMGEHDARRTLVGVTVLGYPDQLVEVEAIAIRDSWPEPAPPHDGEQRVLVSVRRFFYDTEFIEDGVTIDLVSIGVVDETGREFYAVSTEFDASQAIPWVRRNVLDQLPSPADRAWRSRERIREELLRLPHRAGRGDRALGLVRRLRPRRAVPAVGRDAGPAAADPAVHPGAAPALGRRRPARRCRRSRPAPTTPWSTPATTSNAGTPSRPPGAEGRRCGPVLGVAPEVLGDGQRRVPGQRRDDVGDAGQLALGDGDVAGHPALDLPVGVPGGTAGRPRLLDRLVAVTRWAAR